MESGFYKNDVEECEKEFAMRSTNLLKRAKYGKYATSVCFQQIDRPATTFLKGRHYFSGRHSLYVFKTEVLVSFSSKSFYGSDFLGKCVYDKAVFREMLLKQQNLLEKKTVELVDDYREPLQILKITFFGCTVLQVVWRTMSSGEGC